ncbi:MAG: rhomboid family intramembrane serine protease [Saprospiraceae bacterium]
MNKELQEVVDRVKLPAYFVMLLWIIHAFKSLIGQHWTRFGIFSQELDGLKGILFAPLIHADWLHLASNSLPFFITGSLMMLFYPLVAPRAFLMMYFFTGFMVWLFARTGVYHVGASGVVYAMVSFLFWSGIFRRSPKAIFLGLTILAIYGGMFEGILPKQPGVSWESHLLGGLVGIFVAYYFKSELEADEVPEKKWVHVPYEDRPFFLSRDVFDMTREERRLRDEALARQAWLEQQQALMGGEWNSSNTWD